MDLMRKLLMSPMSRKKNSSNSNKRLSMPVCSGQTMSSNVASKLNKKKELSPTHSSSVTTSLHQSSSSLITSGRISPEMRYFGESLEAILLRENGKIPHLVVAASQFIVEKGLQQEGLFRVNGNKRSIEDLRLAIGRSGEVVIKGDTDVMTVASLFKMFLRQLPDPLVPMEMTDLFLKLIASNPSPIEKCYNELRRLCGKLPARNYDTLKYLVQLLVLVARHEIFNKMSAQALGIVFGPNLFRTNLRNQGTTNYVVSCFITGYDYIFKTEQEKFSHDAGELCHPNVMRPAPSRPKLSSSEGSKSPKNPKHQEKNGGERKKPNPVPGKTSTTPEHRTSTTPEHRTSTTPEHRTSTTPEHRTSTTPEHRHLSRKTAEPVISPGGSPTPPGLASPPLQAKPPIPVGTKPDSSDFLEEQISRAISKHLFLDDDDVTEEMNGKGKTALFSCSDEENENSGGSTLTGSNSPGRKRRRRSTSMTNISPASSPLCSSPKKHDVGKKVNEDFDKTMMLDAFLNHAPLQPCLRPRGPKSRRPPSQIFSSNDQNLLPFDSSKKPPKSPEKFLSPRKNPTSEHNRSNPPPTPPKPSRTETTLSRVVQTHPHLGSGVSSVKDRLNRIASEEADRGKGESRKNDDIVTLGGIFSSSNVNRRKNVKERVNLNEGKLLSPMRGNASPTSLTEREKEGGVVLSAIKSSTAPSSAMAGRKANTGRIVKSGKQSVQSIKCVTARSFSSVSSLPFGKSGYSTAGITLARKLLPENNNNTSNSDQNENENTANNNTGRGGDNIHDDEDYSCDDVDGNGVDEDGVDADDDDELAREESIRYLSNCPSGTSNSTSDWEESFTQINRTGAADVATSAVGNQTARQSRREIESTETVETAVPDTAALIRDIDKEIDLSNTLTDSGAGVRYDSDDPAGTIADTTETAPEKNVEFLEKEVPKPRKTSKNRSVEKKTSDRSREEADSHSLSSTNGSQVDDNDGDRDSEENYDDGCITASDIRSHMLIWEIESAIDKISQCDVSLPELAPVKGRPGSNGVLETSQKRKISTDDKDSGNVSMNLQPSSKPSPCSSNGEKVINDKIHEITEELQRFKNQLKALEEGYSVRYSQKPSKFARKMDKEMSQCESQIKRCCAELKLLHELRDKMMLSPEEASTDQKAPFSESLPPPRSDLRSTGSNSRQVENGEEDEKDGSDDAGENLPCIPEVSLMTAEQLEQQRCNVDMLQKQLQQHYQQQRHSPSISPATHHHSPAHSSTTRSPSDASVTDGVNCEEKEKTGSGSELLDAASSLGETTPIGKELQSVEYSARSSQLYFEETSPSHLQQSQPRMRRHMSRPQQWPEQLAQPNQLLQQRDEELRQRCDELSQKRQVVGRGRRLPQSPRLFYSRDLISVHSSEQQGEPERQVVQKQLADDQQLSLLENQRKFIEGLENELEAAREEDDRTCSIASMSREQLKKEKTDMQKALLKFEHVFGRPTKRSEKALVRNIYGRYSEVKRLLKEMEEVEEAANNVENSFLNRNSRESSPEDSTRGTSEDRLTQNSFSESCHGDGRRGKNLLQDLELSLLRLSMNQLIEEKSRILKEKLLVGKELKSFEKEIFRVKGREAQKDDKLVMQDEYRKLKELKAQLRLVESLINKKGVEDENMNE